MVLRLGTGLRFIHGNLEPCKLLPLVVAVLFLIAFTPLLLSKGFLPSPHQDRQLLLQDRRGTYQGLEVHAVIGTYLAGWSDRFTHSQGHEV